MTLPLDRPPQNRLQIPFMNPSDDYLAALAAVSWWPELEFLDASFSDFSSVPNWKKLWSGPDLALRELRLCYPDTKRAVDVIHGALPHLRVLALCGEIGDEFLQELAGVSLPALEDLEVRKTNITPEAMRAFALSKRPGLSALKRLGIAFGSDRRQDYTDWNGPLVGWGYEPMTDLELQYDILSGSGLLLMPTNYDWPK